MSRWLDYIEIALENLGGIAKLTEIYEAVKKIKPPPYPESFAIIRGTIENHSSDSAKFNGKDIFFSAGGIGKGIWGLRESVSESPAAQY